MKTFVPLTDEEFENKIDAFLDDESFTISDLVSSQNDVKFDFENFEYYPDTSDAFKDLPINSIMGFSKVDDFQYWGCYAGGDWEYPVYFILYWDGDKVCSYVPMSSGNRFNRKTNKAYGNALNYKYDENHQYIPLDYTDDCVDLKEHFPDIFEGMDFKDIDPSCDVPILADEDVEEICQELHKVFNLGEDNDLSFRREGFIIWCEDVRTQDKQYVSVPYGAVIEDNSHIEKSFIFDTKDECNRWVANRAASVKMMFNIAYSPRVSCNTSHVDH